jgi:hypothetical protein
MQGDVAVSSILDGVQIRALVLSQERRRHQAATARTRIGRQPEVLNRESGRDATSGFAESDDAPPWM